MTNTSRPDPPPRVVDVHAHAVPPDLLAALRSRRHGPLPELDGHDRIRFGPRSTPPVSAALTDAAARLAAMDDTGVDVQVVSPWLELSPDELEPEAAAAFLRLLNDGMASLAAAESERLRALVLLDRRDPAAATAELARTAAVPGVVGVELAAAGSGPPLHDPAWDRLWSEASALGSFVLLHPWQRPQPPPATPDDMREGLRLGDIVDNPAQSTAVVGAMVLAGVFDRHPDLRVCVVHGGGFLPYQAGRFDAIARLAPDRPDGARTPGDVLRTLYYDSLTHSARSLAWLVEFAGADRVLLGSDYPFPTGDAAAVRTVTAAPGLTQADRAAVLGANACRLFGR